MALTDIFGGEEAQAGISGPGFAGQPAPPASAQAPKKSIWDDPNLLAIMLGQMGAAVMGEHQQSWQAQVGKGAAGIGQSFKMADVVARREQERKEERDRWMKIIEGISGLHKPGEAATMEIGDISTISQFG